MLALTGPFRAARQRTEPPASLAAFLPALLSIMLATGVAVFFTMYASPFGRTPPAGFPSTRTDIHDLSQPTAAAFAQLRDIWGVTGILFTTVLLLVPVLLLVSRWLLAMAGIAAGIVAELLAPSRTPRPATAAATAAALWLAYFAIFQLAYGVGWSAELWLGSVVLAALVAATLTLITPTTAVAAPPRLPVGPAHPGADRTRPA